jgi:hypothetical protein
MLTSGVASVHVFWCNRMKERLLLALSHRLRFEVHGLRLKKELMRYNAFLPATDEMRECCSLLSHEMLHWPGVKMFHLFGTFAFYHRKVMFAMLPDKRCLDGERTISFLKSHRDDADPQQSWQTFELTNSAKVDDALVSLERAYRDSQSVAVSSPAVRVSA